MTLVMGHNNGGKSSLLRSLPLLADSLASVEIDALDFDSRLRPFDLSYDSLRWKGWRDSEEPSIGIGVDWQDGVRCDWTLREVDDWRRVIPEHVSLGDEKGALELVWKIRRSDARTAALMYRSASRACSVTYRGLLPESADDKEVNDRIAPIRDRLSAFASAVLWLRNQRPAPPRVKSWKGAVRWSLDPDGNDAAVVLAGEHDLREEVSAWYAQHTGFSLTIDELRRREVRTLFRNEHRASYDIDLIDMGEGLAEVLPVLTAVGMARRWRERAGYRVIAIEEPEAHLHPDLQQALAAHVARCVAETTGIAFVLETHSEQMLLALRLQIVSRLISPNDVAIYWVRLLDDGRSVADFIELDDDGRFRGPWPPGAFQEDLAVAAAIQKERGRREQ